LWLLTLVVALLPSASLAAAAPPPVDLRSLDAGRRTVSLPNGVTLPSVSICARREPTDPESPFMIEWWASPPPVDARFRSRARRNAAAIPLRLTGGG